jgi:hypothetical protein
LFYPSPLPLAAQTAVPAAASPHAADAERLARIVARQEYRLLHLTAAYDALLARALAAERALSSTK